ncbi:prenyltransferase [Aliiglaciecola sp. M165]|uniref:prenyltransferase n=1 Tax=Aliiglaciecola sp. M165 TaxID=2593649 RepID=UPI00117ED9A4|nr:prenyltransferase [Aliiglaciecola sp. M165]TRY33441.1 prenyltransferase [Aliiglaciecola sp. M165]
MRPTTFKTIIGSMRLPFLILAPVSVFLGLSVAITLQQPIQYSDFVLVMFGAICAHISVNTLNEYFDYKTGLDTTTVKTPFSGGSGALVINPDALKAVLNVGIISLVFTMLIGLYFILKHGLLLLPLGLVGVALVLSYTPWLNQRPWLCFIAPGLGFGPLMVVGTYVVLSQEYHALVWYVSLLPFLLSNNLLLLNQLPDIEPDKHVGRRHLAIAYGPKFAVWVYLVNVVLAISLVLVGLLSKTLPMLSAMCLPLLVVGFWVSKGAFKHHGNTEKLLPFMGLNVAIALITPFLLALSLILR